MTVSSESIKLVAAGNGTATSFAFTFKVIAVTDLEVRRVDASGAETVLTYNVDYDVTLNADQNANPGGTVTYPISGSPLPSGEWLVIRNLPTFTQPTDLATSAGYRGQTVEELADRLAILTARLNEELGRALRASPGDTRGYSNVLDNLMDRANRVLGFDSSGAPMFYTPESYITTAANIPNVPAGNISATDVQAAINELDAEKIATTEKGKANGVATLDAVGDPVQAVSARNGKAISLSMDTNLETWADTQPASGLYDVYLTTAQGNLPSGWWYIELVRYSGDVSTNPYHFMRATSMDANTGRVFLNQNYGGTWSGWQSFTKDVAGGIAGLNTSGELTKLPAGASAANPTDVLHADGTWSTPGGLLTMPVLAKTAAYTVQAADKGKLIAANGTFTITLPSAVIVGDGFTLAVKNVGNGSVTVAANGTETIDGTSSHVLSQYDAVLLVCDGATWHAIVTDWNTKYVLCNLSASFYGTAGSWANVSGWNTLIAMPDGSVTHNGTTFTFNQAGVYEVELMSNAYNATLNVMSCQHRLLFSTFGSRATRSYSFVGTANAYGGLPNAKTIVTVSAGETLNPQFYININANGGCYLLTSTNLLIKRIA